MERSHSGLVRTLGKRVTRKGSGVRIPPSPDRQLFIGCDPSASKALRSPSIEKVDNQKNYSGFHRPLLFFYSKIFLHYKSLRNLPRFNTIRYKDYHKE